MARRTALSDSLFSLVINVIVVNAFRIAVQLLARSHPSQQQTSEADDDHKAPLIGEEIRLRRGLRAVSG